MKLQKIGRINLEEEEEEVPDNYEPLCPHLGEWISYKLKDVKCREITGFSEVTSMLLDRIEQLEAIVEKLVGDLYEKDQP